MKNRFSNPSPIRYCLVTFSALAGLFLVSFPGCTKPAADSAAGKPAETALALESDDQRVSYAIAHGMGSNIARQGGLTVDSKAFMAGLEDGLSGAKPRIDNASLQAAFEAVQKRAEAASAAAAEANVAAARDLLQKNGARDGVITTASGLQYEVMKIGTGPKPKSSDTVEVHYHGTLTDGTVFDSSVERGETVEFLVTGVIPGWVEALQLMPVGGKWKLVVPPALAYGNTGKGRIPPGSALIFEVELIAIK